MWHDISKGFQFAFETAWSAYKAGSTPIGSCVLNERGEVAALGRNQTGAKGDGLISFHQLAHAEANAILSLSEKTTPNEHPNIRKYTLYSTMEPCPFCFGAIVMGSIRNLKYAARDGVAGAAALNGSIDYIKKKKISVEGPFDDLELLQIAMQTCFEISHHERSDYLTEKWSVYCPAGVETGIKLHKSGTLNKLANQNADIRAVYELIRPVQELANGFGNPSTGCVGAGLVPAH
jgi:tRNA(adenine34) deaminase